MIKPLQTFLVLLLLFCTTASYAQTQTLTGFSNFRQRAITPIYEGSEVRGYIMFYHADKADKYKDNYGLDFFDQDLQKVKTVMLPKDRYYTHLLRSSYNGEAFSFYFYNARRKMLEIDVFDRKLNKIASKEFTKLSKGDQSIALQELQMPGNGDNKPISGLNLFAVPNKGFIKNGYTGMMKGYSLEMYDNNLNLKWAAESDEKSKDYESLLVNEVTDKYVLATIARRPNMLSKKITFSIAAFDVVNGKKVMDMAIETDNSQQLSMSSFSFDNKSGEFVTMGEYYKPEDKVLVDKSQGFFIKRFGLDGKESVAKFFSWEKNINPLLPQEAKPSLEEGFVNYVHKIVRGADGKLHIVAEQYRVKADGVGIALAVLGGGTSTAKGIIGNMMIYTLGAGLELEKVSFFQKDETECTLPAGSGFYGAGMIGLIIDMTGGFNYQFTQEENSQGSFNTAFINYKKEKKNKYWNKTLVNIISDGTADLKTDRINVSSNKETVSYVYPAKPGYVLVLDNQSEEKTLEMKLVKLNK